MGVNSIHLTNTGFINSTYDSANNIPKVFREEQSKQENKAVEVTISKQGKQAYRSKIQSQGNMTYEEAVKNWEDTAELKNKNLYDVNYSFAIGNKLAQIKEGKDGYRTWEEKGSELLEAYASVYDEIVKGYEDGSVNHYVVDENEESGYRRLTLEEELADLDRVYERYASFYETQAEQSATAKNAFEDTIKKLESINSRKSEGFQKMKDTVENLSNDKVPENMAEKLSGARRVFLNLYSQNGGNHLNIKGLLETIKIFE